MTKTFNSIQISFLYFYNSLVITIQFNICEILNFKMPKLCNGADWRPKHNRSFPSGSSVMTDRKQEFTSQVSCTTNFLLSNEAAAIRN